MGIKERIESNFTPGMKYSDLERKCFPDSEYPKAWRCSMNGGPPGCRMPMMAALKRYGYVVHGGLLPNREVFRFL